jgi:hypothetical protein
MNHVRSRPRLSNVASDFADFARLICHGSSPLYERLVEGLVRDPPVLSLAARCRRGQPPNLFFAAVHFLLLKGVRHELSTFYASITGAQRRRGNPYPYFRAFCLEHYEAVLRLISTRLVQTNEVARYACLVPAFALVAQRAQGRPLAMIEVGASAGLGLLWDSYSYDFGRGGRCGARRAAVQITCAVRGRYLPPLPINLPHVGARIGLDLNPIDVGDAEATLWLQALVFPEHRERAERLRRALQLARRKPPRVLAGNAADALPTVLRDIPADVPICVFHSFTLSQLPEAARVRFTRTLARLAAERELYHVSLEWLTAAEQPLLELINYDGTERAQTEVLAACEPHGRWLMWQHRNGQRDS